MTRKILHWEMHVLCIFPFPSYPWSIALIFSCDWLHKVGAVHQQKLPLSLTGQPGCIEDSTLSQTPWIQTCSINVNDATIIDSIASSMIPHLTAWLEVLTNQGWASSRTAYTLVTSWIYINGHLAVTWHWQLQISFQSALILFVHFFVTNKIKADVSSDFITNKIKSAQKWQK